MRVCLPGKNKDQIRLIRKKYSSFDDKALFTALEHAMERNGSDDEDEEDARGRPSFDFDDFSINDEFISADIQREFEEDHDSPISFTSPAVLPYEE
ncbi:putative malate:quinone oxidoreductase [Frankliniella fusca]|uniref:Malate:quinone oxidoreductase n=1 Tax=Frankliniella fusca TaxID=407009 RepID=A0AAE1LGY4_9NEOP|nr:putative malate:quinone oxidoreductase [Frankliniella fusca]